MHAFEGKYVVTGSLFKLQVPQSASVGKCESESGNCQSVKSTTPSQSVSEFSVASQYNVTSLVQFLELSTILH